MNKRTAIALAAGLIVALLIGIASVSLSSPTSAVADPGTRSPRVRTVQRTVTVHRTASPSTATSTAAPAVDDHGVDGPNHDAFDDHGDDGLEQEPGDDHGDDDAFEDQAGDDHGDDAFEDDHSGPSDDSGHGSDDGGSDNSGPGSDSSGSGHDGSDDD